MRRIGIAGRGGRGRPSVAVVGGGLGGIAASVYLKRAGFTDFIVFEAEAGPGGTWWRNTYPGAEVDVHSVIYSFSFRSRNWTRTHAKQPELMEYINDIIDGYDLRKHFRLSTRIDEARWDETQHRYHLRLDTGETIDFDVVVSAVGFLSDPKFPDWPGLDTFAGPAFHTLYWDHGLDLTGKRVALVGTGSTATQIAPAIADKVGKLTIFQREPGWILRKGDRDFTPEEMARYSTPLPRRIRRLRMYARYQWSYVGGAIHHTGSKRNTAARERSLAFIDEVFADRPDLKEKVTPRYEFSGKRRVLQDSFYPALLRENVELVAHPVVSVRPHSIVDDQGVEHEADVLIMSTGFHASRYLSTVNVYGRDGRSIQDVWADGAFAFMGMTVPNFPNFYMLYGPNTNGGPILSHHELQAKYIVRELRTMMRRHVSAIEVRPGIVRLYNYWLQGRLARTAWANANNYMKAPSGRIVTQWGDGLVTFWMLHKIPRWITSTYRRRPAA